MQNDTLKKAVTLAQAAAVGFTLWRDSSELLEAIHQAMLNEEDPDE